jgi:hypothetical protein
MDASLSTSVPAPAARRHQHSLLESCHDTSGVALPGRPSRQAAGPGPRKARAVRIRTNTLSAWLRSSLGAIAACLALVMSVAGCGDGESDPVVARVGHLKLHQSAIAHWAQAIHLGGLVTRSVGSDRMQALDYLIFSQWLIDEAAKQGLSVPQSAVDRVVQERLGPLAHRRDEIEKSLVSMGQTISDVELEERAALSATKLRRAALRVAPPATRSEISSYYERHRILFHMDRRVVDLIEGLETTVAARALGRHLGPGERFEKQAIREVVRRPSLSQMAHASNGRLVRAIFAARVGQVAGPASYNRLWVMLVVRRIIPGRLRPLDEVTGDISKHLAEAYRRSVLESFIEGFQRRSRAETTCTSKLIVPECSNYRGTAAPARSLGDD